MLLSTILICATTGALLGDLGDIVGAVAEVPVRAVEAASDVAHDVVDTTDRVLTGEPRVEYEEVPVEVPVYKEVPVEVPVYKEVPVEAPVKERRLGEQFKEPKESMPTKEVSNEPISGVTPEAAGEKAAPIEALASQGAKPVEEPISKAEAPLTEEAPEAAAGTR